MQFKKNLESLRTALDNAIKNNVSLEYKIDKAKAIIDYKSQQKKYIQERLEKALKAVKESSFELRNTKHFDELSQIKIADILGLVLELDNLKTDELNKIVKKIENLVKQIRFPTEDSGFVKIPKKIPSEIKEDLVLDLEEMQRCYDNECYRSCVILCGRVLETALHRKYYEVTGQDALEKSPGIGLGNLIAKLNERKINLDPGLTNQIHLINQVRIFSVHKKQEAFYPSAQQTQAMILYTLDILEKIFIN
jgi:hypothetical protein